MSILRGFVEIIWRQSRLIVNNEKVNKTISKMAEPPKTAVRNVVFLTEVDFSLKAAPVIV